MAGNLIFMTGATGFLGRHLVPRLLAEGFLLRLLVRQASETSWLPSAGVELVTGDITDAPTVEKASSGAAYLIHAAGHFRFWGSVDQFERANVLGTAVVARAARLSRVARLIHISAIALAGPQPAGVRIDENITSQPRDPYQRTKLEAELLLRQQHQAEGLPVVILRPGAYYGPFGHYGFNRLFIEDPLRGVRVQVDNGQRMTFPVYVPDVASAVVAALTKAKPGEIYNISDQPVSHAEVNQLVSELLGISPRRWNIPARLIIALAALMELGAKVSGREPFYPLNLRYYVFSDWLVDSSKAQRDLDFSPTPLQEGLRQTIAWYRQGA